MGPTHLRSLTYVVDIDNQQPPRNHVVLAEKFHVLYARNSQGLLIYQLFGKNLSKFSRKYGSTENDQHQKMMNMAKSENDQYLNLWLLMKKESDQHQKMINMAKSENDQHLNLWLLMKKFKFFYQFQIRNIDQVRLGQVKDRFKQFQI